MKDNWFATWFDTPYYHILYKDRNDVEAKRFISNLNQSLSIPKNARVLDLACGKGRHAVMLNELGFSVVGADLSENSIKIAAASQKEGLTFIVHDMREVIPNESFDAVYNLFTSFGYFDETSENQKVLKAIHAMLSRNGILVIDFMNASKVTNQLVREEVKIIDGIKFEISRTYNGTHIYKDIQFEDKGEKFHFTECVQALTIDNFKSLLSEGNFEILRTFGDIELTPFDEKKSDRLIVIARKK